MTYTIIAVVVLAVILFLYISFKQDTGNFQNINGDDAKKLIENTDNIVVLDVRTPGEIKNGKIKGAKELNVTSPKFIKGLDDLDTSKTYLVYCRSGSRSKNACRVMGKKGFEKLYNLDGGYMNWKE